jgi:hypothetical protein
VVCLSNLRVVEFGATYFLLHRHYLHRSTYPQQRVQTIEVRPALRLGNSSFASATNSSCRIIFGHPESQSSTVIRCSTVTLTPHVMTTPKATFFSSPLNCVGRKLRQKHHPTVASEMRGTRRHSPKIAAYNLIENCGCCW